jgi:hypothetical protein
MAAAAELNRVSKGQGLACQVSGEFLRFKDAIEISISSRMP